jgi:hypothetical protein
MALAGDGFGVVANVLVAATTGGGMGRPGRHEITTPLIRRRTHQSHQSHQSHEHRQFTEVRAPRWHPRAASGQGWEARRISPSCPQGAECADPRREGHDSGVSDPRVGRIEEAGLLDAAPAAASGRTCSGCGHGKTAHEHYRRGTDCSLCDCPRYRRQIFPTFRLRKR